MSENITKESGTRWILWLIILGLVAIVAVIVLVIAIHPGSGTTGYNNGSGWDMMGDWGGLWWMMLIPVFFFLLLLVILIYLVMSPRSLATSPSNNLYSGIPPGSPAEILDGRYSRGEINREQYLKMKDDIGARPPAVQ